jgi:hypothetical protein
MDRLGRRAFLGGLVGTAAAARILPAAQPKLPGGYVVPGAVKFIGTFETAERVNCIAHGLRDFDEATRIANAEIFRQMCGGLVLSTP